MTDRTASVQRLVESLTTLEGVARTVVAPGWPLVTWDPDTHLTPTSLGAWVEQDVTIHELTLAGQRWGYLRARWDPQGPVIDAVSGPPQAWPIDQAVGTARWVDPQGKLARRVMEDADRSVSALVLGGEHGSTPAWVIPFQAPSHAGGLERGRAYPGATFLQAWLALPSAIEPTA